MSDRNSKLLARFQVYLEKEEKSDVQEQVQETKIAQTAFWSEMRNILAVNAGSSGLDVLDEVAKALIEETGLTAQAQSGPVTILPQPSRQAIRTGPLLACPSLGPPRCDQQRTSRRRAAPPRSRGPRPAQHRLQQRSVRR
ncbi:hypothetical protein PF010_g5375 [Phytophthora fragariae]|uniref:Uncharacterized protein n=1 Tax=Phytophthora fragariae TaxID=53985 RepID=A0A6A3F7U1_9STRA|nr:hypothetical protein PF009_g8841 [Phytophthora fragariae]KAE9015628.1 hypothetical protein PF011_g7539 [Phytophthora fragariae]KAE9091656.1 hypothetical protein PF007_g18793 [Phytophthora fragariae]KAE9114425.1 hypothetical protein PF006_g19526 [Phytophthora fragariae]KAE9126142.1 hypothetical protein PF010_g5375 [Phytophthora fragariae]